MIGVARPLAWYAAPRSVMKAVGRVGRPDAVPGLSLPRGETAPPITSIVGRAAFTRVVGLREQRLVGGRGRVAAVVVELRQPEAVEVRLVADDHVASVGYAGATIEAAYAAKSALVGVGERRRLAAEVASPATSTWMPSSSAAVDDVPRGRCCSSADSARARPGAQSA